MPTFTEDDVQYVRTSLIGHYGEISLTRGTIGDALDGVVFETALTGRGRTLQ